jgi:hypothetical protein
MKFSDRFHLNPPPMVAMQREARQGSAGHYDQQGRYCAPATEVSFSALEQNINALHDYQHTQWTERVEILRLLDEKFTEMEQRIQDALSLMQYTVQFYPEVMTEWRTAQKVKVRIGVDAPVT